MLKVLIVEDEEMIRKGIVLTVDWAALDCVVVGEATNGVQGLEAARRLEETAESEKPTRAENTKET